MYKSVSLKGFEKVPPDINKQVIKDIAVDTTQKYTQQDVKTNIDNITLYLQNNGYMYAQFDSTVIYMDTIKYRTNLDVYYSTGNRYQISKIVVDKNGVGSQSVDDQLLS